MQNDLVDNLRLDINKHRVKACLYVRVGDTRTRTLHITISNAGEVYDLTDLMIAEMLIKKPDGNVCDQSMIRYGNELQYTLRTQDINAEGEDLCQVMLTFKDGAVVTSPEFSIMCYEKEVSQEVERSTNEYTAISQMVVMANEYAEQANSAKEEAKASESITGNNAERAESAATDAEATKGTVLQYKNDAEISASKALEYKNDAKTYKDQADASQRNAYIYETRAAEAERKCEEALGNMQDVSDILYMINPVTGQMDDIKSVIMSVYYNSLPGFLTAAGYDALELTASGYDAYEITATDYINNGANILGR